MTEKLGKVSKNGLFYLGKVSKNSEFCLRKM